MAERRIPKAARIVSRAGLEAIVENSVDKEHGDNNGKTEADECLDHNHDLFLEGRYDTD